MWLCREGRDKIIITIIIITRGNIVTPVNIIIIITRGNIIITTRGNIIIIIITLVNIIIIITRGNIVIIITSRNIVIITTRGNIIITRVNIIIIITRGNIIISYRCYKITFLGQFAKLRKATISFLMSVRPSVCLSQWNNSAPTGRIFKESDI